MMQIFGIPIEVDDTLLEDKLKFVHLSGEEQVFNMDGSEVVEADPEEQ